MRLILIASIILLYCQNIISASVDAYEVSAIYTFETSNTPHTMWFTQIEDNNVELNDSDIMEYASSKFNKEKMMHKRIKLGIHNTNALVAEYPCSDLCPNYTIRVIRYDLELTSCNNSGGLIQKTLVPISIGVASVLICIPEVLKDYYEE